MSQALDPTDIKALDAVWPIGKKRAYFTLFVVFLLGMFDFIDRQVLAALFPYLKAEYALSDTQLGLLVSIVNISIAVLVLPCGYIIDRWSRKKMIFLMGAVWSLATGACAFAGGYSHLVIARFFVGAGEAGYNPAAQSLLAASFPRHLRATAISILQASMGLGAPIGLMLGAFIAEQYGWRHAFGVVAVPGLVLSLLALLIKDFKNTATPQKNAEKESLAPMQAGSTPPAQASSSAAPKQIWIVEAWSLLRKPSLFCAYVAQAMFLIYQMAAMNWLPTYFNRMAEMPITQASSLAALILFTGTLLAPVGGGISDWLRMRSQRWAALFVAISCLILFLMLSFAYKIATPGSVLQVATLLCSTFFACTLSMMGFAISNDLALPQQRATSVSLMITFQNMFGMVVGPLLTGFLSDIFDLSTSLFLCATFTLISGFLYLIISFTYPRDMAKMPQVKVHFE